MMARPSVMRKSRATLMTKAGPLLSAQALHVSVPKDPPFLRRFRLRRLLTFLWIQGCSSTFFALLKHTNVYFCVNYLAMLVRSGRWTEALDYIVPRFPRDVPLSLEARVLQKFLSKRRSFQLEVARKQLRVDMTPVWAKAAEIVANLANRTPEFRNRLLLPAVPMGQQNVLPIGFGFAPFRRRGHAKKHRKQSSAIAIAKLYLDKRRTIMQLSSTHSNQELSHAEFVAKAVHWLQSIMSTPVTGNVINPGGSSVPLTIDEGDAAVSQTTLGTMACPAEISEVVSAANDGQKVCCTESARQGTYPRRRPMTEQQEDYMDMEKQRTTGADSEASTPILHIMEEDVGAAGLCLRHLQTKIAEVLPAK